MQFSPGKIAVQMCLVSHHVDLEDSFFCQLPVRLKQRLATVTMAQSWTPRHETQRQTDVRGGDVQRCSGGVHEEQQKPLLCLVEVYLNRLLRPAVSLRRGGCTSSRQCAGIYRFHSLVFSGSRVRNTHCWRTHEAFLRYVVSYCLLHSSIWDQRSLSLSLSPMNRLFLMPTYKSDGHANNVKSFSFFFGAFFLFAAP